MRAQRHVAVLPPGPEQGYMATLEATVALFSGDLDGALARSADGIRIGREVGDPELVALAVHTQGLAMIDAGRVAEGLALLEQSAAGQELSAYYIEGHLLQLLSACLAIGDLDARGEWSDAAAAGAPRSADSPFPGRAGRTGRRCAPARLVGRGGGRGRARLRRTAARRRGIGFAAAAFLQLAEIRRRQGDLTAAERRTPRRTSSGGSQPGLALLRLAQGKQPAARAAIAAALGAAVPLAPPGAAARGERRDALAGGSIDDALASAAELGRIAEDTDPAFVAQAAEAAGSVALASGDVDTAWLASGGVDRMAGAAPAVRGVARGCGSRGRSPRRRRRGRPSSSRAALAGFRAAGRAGDAGEVAVLLGTPDAAGRSHHAGGRGPAPARVGQDEPRHRGGAGDQRDTVGRHLQNLYAKLGVSSRSAATAYAFEHGLT
jgi:hypothetical protein